mmetsp:Transcript_14732/g.21782  ORF Transcript_14732/g.21782 Transcript_14732/m.21782 type:complete len:269 (-) Transcript_14732:260-1066(-)
MSSKYGAVPSASAVVTGDIMVEVEAPATLSAGYKFDAMYDGQTFSVTVPPEGVTKGQRIAVPFRPLILTAEATPINSGNNMSLLGQWKDGLCGCCKFGCCHAHLCCAWCCPVALMGQVLTRMKMSWLGNAAVETEYRSTFRKTLYVIIVYFVLGLIFATPSPELTKINGAYVDVSPTAPTWQIIVNNVLNLSFGLYTLIVLTKLRAAVRERYSIQEECCAGCEDCCCAFWCGCCTVAQLARQTADYDVQRAKCCTDTGLEPLPPVLTV